MASYKVGRGKNTYQVTTPEELVQRMLLFTKNVDTKVNAAAKQVAGRMKPRLVAVTPVRTYPGVVRNITRKRVGNTAAVRTEAKAAYQPGAMKSGWVRQDYSTRSKANYYGLRNAMTPTLIHLVNFDHKIISHGKYVGKYRGSGFVDSVSEWGIEQLDGDIEKILKEESTDG